MGSPKQFLIVKNKHLYIRIKQRMRPQHDKLNVDGM
jgi:hypothetical protein